MRRIGQQTIAAAVALGAALLSSPGVADDGETYSYDDRHTVVALEASSELIAVPTDERRLDGVLAGWQRAALSDHHALRVHGLVLYRRRHAMKGATSRAAGVAHVLATARRLGAAAEPVFELGPVLKIPTDEVLVTLAGGAAAADADRAFAPLMRVHGLRDWRWLRKSTFVVRIDDPGNGRAFAVSRALGRITGVVHAEPNCLVVPLPERQQERPRASIGPADLPPVGAPVTSPSPAPTTGEPVPTLSPPGWTTIVSEDVEGPLGAWFAMHAADAADAVPVVTSYRAHSGTHSFYMTGGGPSGVPAPGPYPVMSHAILYTGPLDLARFEEVYVELWFFARYETFVYPNDPVDLGFLVLRNPGTGALAAFGIAVRYTGDLTTDPTTAAGWRRMLVRVPPALRTDGVQVAVDFISDGGIGAEGLYVDDVRIVGTTDVDTQPISNDPYGGRQYELANTGQIAGLGTPANDLGAVEAWSVVTPSPDLLVAVVDEGLDLGHPDLHLVTGYDAPSGAVGGGPKSDGENHGTACAGNVGAIGNNGKGVLGTAPGVKIMPIHRGTTEADYAVAIDLAVDHGARVISNSWGWVGAPNTTITDAVEDALGAGRVVLFAAGNGPERPPWSYETAFPCKLTQTTDVICVGASSPTDEYKGAASSDGIFTWGSSWVGPGPDVVAPGPWSYTTDRQGASGYNTDATITGIDADYDAFFGGTSSATPKVAGVVALVLSRNPTLTPGAVKTLLRTTATDIDVPGVDDRTGAGRVDAFAAVLAAGGATTTTTSSTSTSTLAAAVRGDCDLDGEAATLFDVVATIDVALGRIPPSPARVARCDTTCDALVNVFDAIRTIDAKLGRIPMPLTCPATSASSRITP